MLCGKPISAKEHKRLDKLVKASRQNEEVLSRNPWQERGLDFHGEVEGHVFVSIQFTDGKNFHIQSSPNITLDVVESSYIKTGDDKILKTYQLRKDI